MKCGKASCFWSAGLSFEPFACVPFLQRSSDDTDFYGDSGLLTTGQGRRLCLLTLACEVGIVFTGGGGLEAENVATGRASERAC